MVLPESVVTRFWAAVDKRGPDECWEWKLSCSRGYGQLSSRHGRAPYKAHRVSWMIAHGEQVPVGMEVCHFCDTPACVNPAHLFLGTHHDNMRDMQKKGRAHGALEALRGEANGSSVLTWDEARAIRARFLQGGESANEVSKRFPVSADTVRYILRNEAWVDPAYDPAAYKRAAAANEPPHPSGEDHPQSKMTRQEVECARREHLTGGASAYRLAKKYGVAKSTMQSILKHETWRD